MIPSWKFALVLSIESKSKAVAHSSTICSLEKVVSKNYQNSLLTKPVLVIACTVKLVIEVG